jgi:O-antigen biosynthesis protein
MKLPTGSWFAHGISLTAKSFRFVNAVLQGLLGAYRSRIAKKRISAHFRHVVALASADEPLAQRSEDALPKATLISFVVPVFNTKPQYLDDLVSSFEAQSTEARMTGSCQLVLSDDGSTDPRTLRWFGHRQQVPNLTILRNPENRGIAAATNAGIAVATGTWVGLLDHDDALAPFVVARIGRALGKQPECQFLYTDEVIADQKLRPIDYFLKPAWDPVLLSGVNYINHLSLYRRDRLISIGGLRAGFEGSQDYDLVLRYTAGLPSNDILHLPYPGYIWRRDGQSYSARFLDIATASARRALAQHYATADKPAIIDRAISSDRHRVRFDVSRTDWPKVSIVIPSLDAFPLISRLLKALLNATDYPYLEVVVIDNGSTDHRVLGLYERFRQQSSDFRAEIDEEPFNFSRAVNRGVAIATGDYVCLLNNDIEILEPEWLKEMVSCFDYPDTGVVGAKLLYPDRTLQHAGVIAGLGGLAGHWFIGRDENFPGPMGRLWTRQSLSVVTGACMLISRECLSGVGPFDEQVFPIAYNDVDFCLRAIAKGFRVIWTPFATLIHHESASRGSDETPENIARFNRDKESLRGRHQTEQFEDNAFNPWYSKSHSEHNFVFLDKLPAPR